MPDPPIIPGTDTSRKSAVAVIGAGIAGLSCATTLRQAGVAALWKPGLHVLGGSPGRVPDASLDRFVGLPRMTAPARFLADTLAVTPQARVLELKSGTGGWHLRSAEQGWMDKPFDAAFVNEGALRWVARDSSKPGRPGRETWLLHASAQWSEAHIELPAETVAGELLHAFGQLGGACPPAWTAHRWRYADMAAPLDHGCVWDRDRKLGLCGDWLNGGKVEGAWRSGRRLAEEALLSLQPRGAARAT